jgi:hypothetical protein
VSKAKGLPRARSAQPAPVVVAMLATMICLCHVCMMCAPALVRVLYGVYAGIASCMRACVRVLYGLLV